MNSDPLVALDRLFELADRLGELMHGHLSARGLTPTKAQVLLLLNEGGAMVQRQLSEALGCTPRHVTTLIDALETEDWVKRSSHPTDRRATLVSLTARGEDAAAKLNADRQIGAEWLLGDLSENQLTGFVAVADHVLDRIGSAAVLRKFNETQER